MTNDIRGNTELVIGLIGPIGTNLKGMRHVLTDEIKKAGYCVEPIKVSEKVIPELVEINPDSESKFDEYKAKIKAGNEARKKAAKNDGLHGGNAVLACGVAAWIFANRDDVPAKRGRKTKKGPKSRTAYIIDSLKRPEEVEFLRATYPHGFVLVGVYETEDDRIGTLCGDYKERMTLEEAKSLIKDDEKEEEEDYGQRVRDTFQMADFFVHSTKDLTRLKCDLERMVRIWFGDPFVTPTFEEFAMYMAFASSLRSADLSRQVGAVIARDNDILSTGANDVPKAGGGLYWPVREGACVDDASDGRDFMLGEDSNRVQQLRIINEVADKILAGYSGIKKNDLISILESTTIKDLTEFGRIVHAEMEALMSCLRNGTSTLNATLICTTFPCHNCAKHLVAAGVSRVLYIEPYSKSKAFEFHKDSIARTEPDAFSYEKVAFEPYVGIGPRKFFDLFSIRHGSSYEVKRKESKTGEKREWSIRDSQLRLQMLPNSYMGLELEAAMIFRDLKRS